MLFACSLQKDVNDRTPAILKIPLALLIKLQDMIFEDQIMIGMKFRQIKHTNYKLAVGWRRYQDFI